jgi:hypothetical protein
VFEAKSYNDLRKTFAVGNGFFAAACLIYAYLFVLSSEHKHALDAVLGAIKLNPLIGPLVTVGILGTVWGYLTTFMLSIHDRLYEPHLVSWRAGYETDFILRSLCLPYSARVSQHIFELAFDDHKARRSMLQRLFFRFIGDSKSQHEELLERFYTVIRNYWLLVIAEIYCTGFFIAATIYCLAAAPSTVPYLALLVPILASIILRFWSNRYLPIIRPITLEQVRAILLEHRDEFETALDAVVTEFHLQP